MAARKPKPSGKAGCRIEPLRAGLSLGLLFAILQIVWGLALLVSGGKVAEYMYRMAMLSAGVPYSGFDLLTYAAGVVACYILGFACGALFSFIWNSLD